MKTITVVYTVSDKIIIDAYCKRALMSELQDVQTTSEVGLVYQSHTIIDKKKKRKKKRSTA